MPEGWVAPTVRNADSFAQALRNSALLPATIAAGMTSVSFGLYSSEIDPRFAAFVFCATFGVYQLDRVLGILREDRFTHPGRAVWTLRNRAKLILISCGSVIAALVAGAPYLNRLGAPLLLCGLAALFYSVPIGVDGPRIKDVWWLKPWLVAAAWTVVIVLFPAVLIDASWSGVLLLAGYRFFYIASNVLMCEIAETGGGDAIAGGWTIDTRSAGSGARPGRRSPLVNHESTRTFAIVAGVRLARHSVVGCLFVATVLATAALAVSHVPWLVAVDMVGIALVAAMARPGRVPSAVAVDVAALWPATVPLVLLVLLG